MHPLQKKLVLSLGIGLIILALFVWLVVFSLFNKVKTASQQYLNNQESLANLDKRDSLFNDLEKNYQEMQDDLSGIEEVFLNSQEAVGFISTLETIASQTGNIFEIKSAIPSSSSDEEESFIVLRISLWGDFSELLLFLANLENSPYPPYRLIEIDSLSIKRLGDRDLARLGLGLINGDVETILGIKIYTQ